MALVRGYNRARHHAPARQQKGRATLPDPSNGITKEGGSMTSGHYAAAAEAAGLNTLQLS